MAGFEVWLVVAIIFLIGEMFTEGFFLLWFGLSGLIVAAAAFLGVADDVTQWIIFLVSSSILVVFTRPLASRITKKAPRGATIDALIGEKTHVMETIDPKTRKGSVKTSRGEWRAQADELIPQGAKVEIIKVEGVHVVVKKL